MTDEVGVGPKLSISPNGNVGIGTATPQYTLDVYGTIRGANVAPSDARLKVYPELVSTADYKAVDYAKLSAVLIEAVKDLRHQNAALEARLARLETSRASHASR